MRLLLDTHTFLWLVITPERLSSATRDALVDRDNEVMLSVASAWELAIKQSLGKLVLADNVERWLPDSLRQSRVSIAAIAVSTALRVRSLPFHHKDPFDRLLIAHAFEDGFTIVTRDPAFNAYGVPLMAA